MRKAIVDRLRSVARKKPWLFEGLGAFMAAAALTAATVAAVAEFDALAGMLAAFGLFASASTVAIRARVMDARLGALQRELVTMRLAVGSVARDADSTARSTRRLAEAADRAVAAALSLEAGRAPADGAVMAAMVVLGRSRELHFVGDPEAYSRYRSAFEALGPGLELTHVPSGGESAYLDRRGQRRRGKASVLPAFVAEDQPDLTRAIHGDLADLIVSVLGTSDFLVILPPALRSLALRGGTGSTVHALGDAIVLVHRVVPLDDDPQ
jgi:hypothetical protein